MTNIFSDLSILSGRLGRLASVLVLGFAVFGADALAQDLGRPRSITSDDFVKKRPAPSASAARPTGGSKSGNKARASRRSANYRLGKAERVTRRPGAAKTVVRVAGKNITISELGVTMWRLRPPVLGEEGHRFPVEVNGAREFQVAERVSAASRFNAGDRVRIAIESSTEGYLYVINSEYYANGTYGDPVMIFPANDRDDNRVVPGQLVDIPDQSEDLPYFVINPKRTGYMGESLTVIVSPVRLQSLRIGVGGRIENIDDLITLELKADFDVYARTDNGDKLYSEAESQSGCGARTRELVRAEASAKPCGERTRQLTREEAKPQTIYRVRSERLQAAVAFVRLRVGR